MEYIEFLVSGNVGGICSIEKLKTIVLKKNNIRVTNLSNKTLSDYLYEAVDADEYPELFETIKSEFDFQLDNHNYLVSLSRFTKEDIRFLKCRIETDEITDIEEICNSEWLAFRTELIETLYHEFKEIHWLSDSQNVKITTDLYYKMHEIENYLRSIIDEYMCIKHGETWFERYSYEDYVNKYLKFSEWFRNSRYDLFKKIDNHLYNLEISDIFDALKHAKKIVISKNMKKALESIRNDETNAQGVINTDLLDEPSLWDEEEMEKAFPKNVVSRWDNDFSKRRNMVAHNKMVCIDMYNDTIKSIDFFKAEFIKARKNLFRRLHSDEDDIIRNADREYNISYNMEFCGFDEDFRDADSLMDRIMDTDEIIELHGILEDDIISLKRGTEEAYDYVNAIYDSISETYFFENNEFIGEELLQQYISVLENHPLQGSLSSIVKKEMSHDEYMLVEYSIKEYLDDVQRKLLNVIESLRVVDLKCLHEGVLVEFIGFYNDNYELTIHGEISPERGHTDNLKITVNENEEEISEGYISICYGDYEINSDGIPMPISDEGIDVNISDIIQTIRSILERENGIVNRITELACSVEI